MEREREWGRRHGFPSWHKALWATIDTLRNFGLLKVFKTQSMRKQVLLLENLIKMWDHIDQAFHVAPHILSVEIKDVYFLIGLSMRGAWTILIVHRGTNLSTDEYIARYYIVVTQKSSENIMIKDIVSHPLLMILFTITKLVGSNGPHLASKAQMAYVLEFLEPKVFNWHEYFLVNFKDQVTKFRIGKHKQFGYGSFIVSFLLE